MYSMWQIKTWNTWKMVSKHLKYSFSLGFCEKNKSLAHIIFQLPIQRHLENDLTDLWTNMLFFTHLDTLWWKISICHYLMVWCCLFFDLCLFVFASLFWLPLHFLLSPPPPQTPPEQDNPTSLLWVSTQHPPPPLFPSHSAGVWIAIGTLVN